MTGKQEMASDISPVLAHINNVLQPTKIRQPLAFGLASFQKEIDKITSALPKERSETAISIDEIFPVTHSLYFNPIYPYPFDLKSRDSFPEDLHEFLDSVFKQPEELIGKERLKQIFGNDPEPIFFLSLLYSFQGNLALMDSISSWLAGGSEPAKNQYKNIRNKTQAFITVAKEVLSSNPIELDKELASALSDDLMSNPHEELERAPVDDYFPPRLNRQMLTKLYKIINPLTPSPADLELKKFLESPGILNMIVALDKLFLLRLNGIVANSIGQAVEQKRQNKAKKIGAEAGVDYRTGEIFDDELFTNWSGGSLPKNILELINYKSSDDRSSSFYEWAEIPIRKLVKMLGFLTFELQAQQNPEWLSQLINNPPSDFRNRIIINLSNLGLKFPVDILTSINEVEFFIGSSIIGSRDLKQ